MPSIGVGKRRAYPARTPQRPTVYPTPVWGRADVPGYGAGPFVRSGYKWTARTTELHPDGECMHRPPRGETPGGRDQSQRQAPPHPPTLPGNKPTNNRVEPRSTPRGQNRGQRNTEGKGGGARKRGGQLCRAKCRASLGQQRAGRATESTRSPMCIAHTAFVS